MIKTAVIGASGYIGRHLWRSYRSCFPDCIGTAFSADVPCLQKFDIRRPDITLLRLMETGHKAVLIASAKPNIAYCENNRKAAYEVNVEGTLELARQVGRIGLPVIFLSSDYVFEGTAGPYRDTDPVRPTTEYGRHKAQVEKELPNLVEQFLILRLSKIYNTEKGDKTLLDEMAALLFSGSELLAARDQLFCPTHVNDLVKVIHELQAKYVSGIFNVCSPEGWSRYEIALALADAMRVERKLVKGVLLHDLPGMSSRPLDTRMHPSPPVLECSGGFTPLAASILKVASAWSN
jgi:dTDP-4-dehydrorhamnose reductase